MDDIECADDSHYNEATVINTADAIDRLEHKTERLAESMAWVSDYLSSSLNLMDELDVVRTRLDALQKSYDNVVWYMCLIVILVIAVVSMA